MQLNDTYQPMPTDRSHRCHEVNDAEIPVAWVEYDSRYGFSLETTNAYGDGTTTSINFCPFCGVRLMETDHETVVKEE